MGLTLWTSCNERTGLEIFKLRFFMSFTSLSSCWDKIVHTFVVPECSRYLLLYHNRLWIQCHKTTALLHPEIPWARGADMCPGDGIPQLHNVWGLSLNISATGGLTQRAGNWNHPESPLLACWPGDSKGDSKVELRWVCWPELLPESVPCGWASSKYVAWEELNFLHQVSLPQEQLFNQTSTKTHDFLT